MNNSTIPQQRQPGPEVRQPRQAEVPAQSATERKMVSRIQDSIDDYGRYSNKLKDLSLGYAAGKGISEQEAKQEIGKLFERDLGMSLKSYLEQHRLERGLEVDRNEGRGGR
ncbi:hypothetical protein HAHE_25060 [Haloferula helveola]|uniref:Uncharacterized protein n=1 Tax=Haloferula helveola TaxID=490095 RepID=A0ABM7RGZ5_9BACT|nr:hypothetical protein HAHE_25060 [Haloferula helveola]